MQILSGQMLCVADVRSLYIQQSFRRPEPILHSAAPRQEENTTLFDLQEENLPRVPPMKRARIATRWSASPPPLPHSLPSPPSSPPLLPPSLPLPPPPPPPLPLEDESPPATTLPKGKKLVTLLPPTGTKSALGTSFVKSKESWSCGLTENREATEMSSSTIIQPSSSTVESHRPLSFMMRSIPVLSEQVMTKESGTKNVGQSRYDECRRQARYTPYVSKTMDPVVAKALSRGTFEHYETKESYDTMIRLGQEEFAKRQKVTRNTPEDTFRGEIIDDGNRSSAANFQSSSKPFLDKVKLRPAFREEREVSGERGVGDGGRQSTEAWRGRGGTARGGPQVGGPESLQVSYHGSFRGPYTPMVVPGVNPRMRMMTQWRAEESPVILDGSRFQSGTSSHGPSATSLPLTDSGRVQSGRGGMDLGIRSTRPGGRGMIAAFRDLRGSTNQTIREEAWRDSDVMWNALDQAPATGYRTFEKKSGETPVTTQASVEMHLVPDEFGDQSDILIRGLPVTSLLMNEGIELQSNRNAQGRGLGMGGAMRHRKVLPDRSRSSSNSSERSSSRSRSGSRSGRKKLKSPSIGQRERDRSHSLTNPAVEKHQASNDARRDEKQNSRYDSESESDKGVSRSSEERLISALVEASQRRSRSSSPQVQLPPVSGWNTKGLGRGIKVKRKSSAPVMSSSSSSSSSSVSSASEGDLEEDHSDSNYDCEVRSSGVGEILVQEGTQKRMPDTIVARSSGGDISSLETSVQSTMKIWGDSKYMITLEVISKIFALQNTDAQDGGYWELNQDLGELLTVDFDACYNLLVSSGLKSLGSLAVQEVSRLLATILVLYCLSRSSTWFQPTNNYTTGSGGILSAWIDDFKLRTNIPAGLSDKTASASRYASEKIRKYPLVVSALGLARSWELFIGKLMGVESIFSSETTRD